MLGRKLTRRLLGDGALGNQPITALHLYDMVAPAAGPDHDANVTLHAHTADLGQANTADEIAALNAEVVFHLAGVVSGEAEQDLAKGMRVNLDGTRQLFDALGAAPKTPRVVFTSSLAVYGAPLPDPVPDDFHLTPATSYGTQKAIGELLLADYTRRGLVDGVGVRLPTISVRPGLPNAAASGFFSGIIREPLAGMAATLPVAPDLVHTHASPRTAVNYLVHAAQLPSDALEGRPNLTMPGVGVSVAEQLSALRRVAGDEVADLVEYHPDPFIESIVSTWPARFVAARAEALGFVADPDYDTIIRTYINDDQPQS